MNIEKPSFVSPSDIERIVQDLSDGVCEYANSLLPENITPKENQSQDDANFEAFEATRDYIMQQLFKYVCNG